MPTFEVPASKASIKQNRFEFKMPGSPTKYSLPKLEYIKPSLGLKMTELEVTTDDEGNQTTDPQATAELVRLVFETYFPDEDLFSLFEDSEQFGAWMEAWTAASGVSVGESAASPKS